MLETLQEEFGNFPQVLAKWAAVQPDAPALKDDRRALCWRELVDRIDRVAARLVEAGLERGQSVAILGTSTIDYALVFLGAVRAGGVAAPLTTSASREQLEGMARDSGARHLFIDAAKARPVSCAQREILILNINELQGRTADDVPATGAWQCIDACLPACQANASRR